MRKIASLLPAYRWVFGVVVSKARESEITQTQHTLKKLEHRGCSVRRCSQKSRSKQHTRTDNASRARFFKKTRKIKEEKHHRQSLWSDCDLIRPLQTVVPLRSRLPACAPLQAFRISIARTSSTPPLCALSHRQRALPLAALGTLGSARLRRPAAVMRLANYASF